MINNVHCDIKNILVPVRSIIGIPSELGLSPKITELHEENASTMSILTLPVEQPIVVSKVEMVIEYKISSNEDETNDNDNDSDESEYCNLNEFSQKEKETILELVKNKAFEYAKFCEDEVKLLKHNCSYMRSRINSANINVTDMEIHITFENCDLGRIVREFDMEVCVGLFDSIKSENGHYDLTAHLIE